MNNLCMHGINTTQKVCKHCDMPDEDLAKVKDFQAKNPQLVAMYDVDVPQCTCTKDAEMVCIVHPTDRSLKKRIAQLEAENARLRETGLDDHARAGFFSDRVDELEAENAELERDIAFLAKNGEREMLARVKELEGFNVGLATESVKYLQALQWIASMDIEPWSSDTVQEVVEMAREVCGE